MERLLSLLCSGEESRRSFRSEGISGMSELSKVYIMNTCF
jgi:hypothetical protein